MFRDVLGALCRNRVWTIGVSAESLHTTLTWILLLSVLLPGQKMGSLTLQETFVEGISIEFLPIIVYTDIVFTLLHLNCVWTRHFLTLKTIEKYPKCLN